MVKPASGGSSVGLTLVHTEEQLKPAVAKACQYGGEALVERFVKGKEITVAILGGEVLGSCEISSPARCSTSRRSTKAARSTTCLRASHRRARRTSKRWRSRRTARSVAVGRPHRLHLPRRRQRSAARGEHLAGHDADVAAAKIAKAGGVSFDVLCEQLLELAIWEGADVLPQPAVKPAPALDLHAG